MVDRRARRKEGGGKVIKLSGLKLKPDHTEEDLKKQAARAAGLPLDELISLKKLKRSIEARKKEPLCIVWSVLLTVKNEKRVRDFLRSSKGRSNASKYAVTFVEKEKKYECPYPDGPQDPKDRPVVIGSGPAGLLCAYELAVNGYSPIVAERGLMAKERKEKVMHFWKTGELDPECNIQFGEGGAGTFSDGKLNTGVTDKAGRAMEVLELFVRCGANEDILYDAKPHAGSDVLYEMIQALREEIISLGGTFLFGKRADDVLIENGQLTGVCLSDGTVLKTSHAVFAVGHSARDTFLMLYRRGAAMTPKAFAVGVRCEHDQEQININQWGEDYPKSLGSAPYKLTHKASNGRNVYTFCMCPGGYVINASSEKGGLCVNGMSLRDRSSGKANSAVIVSVTPEDYLGYAKGEIPPELSGAAFQRDLERKAYEEGKGKIPAQRFEDFERKRRSETLPEGCHMGDAVPGDLNHVLPEPVCESLAEGIRAYDRKISCFSGTVLYGVETRTSSPVRIKRDESLQSNIKGLYPCGEGAGYAGGIMSAAIDGIKTAEAVAASLSGKSVSL